MKLKIEKISLKDLWQILKQYYLFSPLKYEAEIKALRDLRILYKIKDEKELNNSANEGFLGFKAINLIIRNLDNNNLRSSEQLVNSEYYYHLPKEKLEILSTGEITKFGNISFLEFESYIYYLTRSIFNIGYVALKDYEFLDYILPNLPFNISNDEEALLWLELL